MAVYSLRLLTCLTTADSGIAAGPALLLVPEVSDDDQEALCLTLVSVSVTSLRMRSSKLAWCDCCVDGGAMVPIIAAPRLEEEVVVHGGRFVGVLGVP